MYALVLHKSSKMIILVPHKRVLHLTSSTGQKRLAPKAQPLPWDDLLTLSALRKRRVPYRFFDNMVDILFKLNIYQVCTVYIIKNENTLAAVRSKILSKLIFVYRPISLMRTHNS